MPALRAVLRPLPLTAKAVRWLLPAQHRAEADHWRPQRHAANLVTNEADIEPTDRTVSSRSGLVVSVSETLSTPSATAGGLLTRLAESSSRKARNISFIA